MGQEETFESDGYVYSIGFSDDFSKVYFFPNSSSCIYEIYTAFVCQ